jgi:cation-transporting ATPase E
VLSEGLRPDARATVDFLREQGVAIKIISGDAVPTVQAVAAAAGVPGAERAISGAELPQDPEELTRVADAVAVFGRITPEQKRELVRALARAGRYVAMVGDGVNDVLALKEARLAIAIGNGSQMGKGVADLVLLTNAFATVPVAVREGRSILRNFHRVAKLFLAKTSYAALLLVTVGLAPIAFPFLPRHLTVVSSLTIGMPAFVLALAHSPGRVRREDFLAGVLAFAARAGVASAAAIAGVYLAVRGRVRQSPKAAPKPLLLAARPRRLTKKAPDIRGFGDRDGRIRTGDHLLPKQVRYQAAPRPGGAGV